MLEVLIALVREGLKKIFDVSVDRVAAKTSQKRSLAVALLELYDAVLALEESSDAALKVFQRYYDGATPMRRHARLAMDSLVKAVETLHKRLTDVYSKLHIYNPHVAEVLLDAFMGKTRTLLVIDGLLAAIPRIKMADKYPTDMIVISTAMPEPSIFSRTTTYDSYAHAQTLVSELRENIDKSLKKREIDIRSRDDLQLLLLNGEMNLRQIVAARNELAEFIRQNVPISSILD